MNAPANVPHQQAPSVLLLGPSGSGKTHALTTILEAGLELFVIITEPHGLETLLTACASKGLPTSNLHWMEIFPARPGFDSLEQMARKVSIMDQGALANLKPGGERQEAQWIKLLNGCREFTDGKDGKKYGAIDSFGPARAVAVDSLSGLNAMAMDITIGDKVTANPGEWGIAMKQLEKFLMLCTSNLRCLFVLTAHIEREIDENTGVGRIMASTLGRKLAPTIPRYFSEVILAKRNSEGEREAFEWSNAELNHDLKRRALPLGSKLQPSFAPIVEAYKKRVEMVRSSG